MFKNFPLTRIHPFAYPAAKAAMAADTRGRFWAFHDALYAAGGGIDAGRIARIRTDLDLADKEFETLMEGPEIARRIQRDYDEGRRSGVDGTPTLFVNGRRFKAPKSLENLLGAVERELAGGGP